MNVLENLAVEQRHGRSVYVCTGCDAELGASARNYKELCLCRERPIAEVGRLFQDPRRFVDDDIVFREFMCPVCGRSFDTEVNRASEPPVHDICINTGA